MTLSIVLGLLFGVSETLAQIPAIKSNSVFQLVSGLIANLNGKS